MVAGCRTRPSIPGLVCNDTVTEPVNSDHQMQLHDFKCEAKYVAHYIKILIGRSDGNDWYFTNTTGPLGCE